MAPLGLSQTQPLNLSFIIFFLSSFTKNPQKDNITWSFESSNTSFGIRAQDCQVTKIAAKHIPHTLSQKNKMSSSRSQERVDELEAQVKYLQTQLAQLLEEKRRGNRSPSHSRTQEDSDESEREERSYVDNSNYEENTSRRP